MDENTFEEVKSYSYRRWYPWAAIMAIIGLSLLVVAGILSLKPLKALLARSYDGQSAELLRLRATTLELEELATAQNLMIGNLQKIINGEVIRSSDSIAKSLAISDSVRMVPRIEEDERIRSEIAVEDALAQSSVPSKVQTESNSRPLKQLYLVPPVSGGSVSLGFDPSKQHLGIDVNAPAGTPVKSVLAGHIIYAGWTLETGNTVGIQHSNNLISFYKHNSALLKQTGAYIQAGEAVAIIGNTGTLSSGPHLHFELWSDGKPVDPVDFIDF
ncbi:MAG: M23 family metallopeptidase [Saprospiraceae bacterium]|nr:M23 family metallopeptidase [Saprospiraceae bacterium]